MGSYSSPVGYQWHYEKLLVDNTTPQDTYILDLPRIGDFWGLVTTSPVWNGDLSLLLQKEDGNYNSNTQHWDQSDKTRFIDKGFWSAIPMDYPLHLKIQVSTACTTGNALVYVVWLDAPTNPLF